jgi:hypothetical protein
MAEAEMRRLGRALCLGVLGAVAAASCGGEAKTDVNEEVATGGKSSQSGGTGVGGAAAGVATGGAQPKGGAAAGGAKASGGTVSSFGGSLVNAGAPASGGTGAAGATTGGSTATGGVSTASGGADTGGRAAAMGGRASMGGRPSTMGGRDGSGGGTDLPDDSCLMDCEVSAAGNPMCEERLTWVCFGGGNQVFNTPECEALPTQVPRFCCEPDFSPCE